MTKVEITDRLKQLYQSNKWAAKRSLIRSIDDDTAFISNNVILILEKCDIIDDELNSYISEAKAKNAKFQRDHLSYHWPLISGHSVLPNARVLNRFSSLYLSPDADCSSLQQLVQSDGHLDAVCKELTYYRLGNNDFELMKYQRKLPNTRGTFLTWFPEDWRQAREKRENIDLSVQANILFLLSSKGRQTLKGYQETVAFVKEVLATDLIIRQPFVLSSYYPTPLLILYMLSRAIDWGQISELQDQKGQILNLLKKTQIKSGLDLVLAQSICKHCDDLELIKEFQDRFQLKKLKTNDSFYIAPLALPLVQNHPLFLALAKQKWTQFHFHSEAIRLALQLWLLK